MHIVIADSNSLVRVGLHTLLSKIPFVDSISEVCSSIKLLDYVRHNSVDMVIIDYTSKHFNIDIIPKILQKRSHIRILAITPEQNATILVNALKSGVYSYVKKDCSVNEIVDAVLETRAGKRFFCGEILQTIQKSEININDIDTEVVFSCEAISLSEREVEIIKMIAEGLTNTQIADILFISNHTINTHRKNILRKLGVKNTAGIVMYAVKMDLVSPNKFLFASENKNIENPINKK